MSEKVRVLASYNGSGGKMIALPALVVSQPLANRYITQLSASSWDQEDDRVIVKVEEDRNAV